MAAYLIFRLLPNGLAEWSESRSPSQTVQSGDLASLARRLKGKRGLLAYPGEHIHCLSLQAPNHRRNAWLRALPYALEDLIAQDMDTLHLAIGQLSGDQQAVAVVQREALRQTLDQLAQQGISPVAIVPDFLLLPYETGQWTVQLAEKRALVRCGRDMGFVCETENLMLWLSQALTDKALVDQPDSLRILGSERIIQLNSETLGLELAHLSTQNEERIPLLQRADLDVSTSLNLRQGEFARQSAVQQQWRQWRAAAVLAGMGLLSMTAKDIVEWRQLATEQTQLRSEIEQTFRQLLPTARLVNPRVQLETYLRQNQASGSATSSGFLPLLGVAANTLHNHPTLRLQGLNFRQDRLELDLRGGSLEQLDTLKATLDKHSGVAAEINASVREGQVLSRLRLRYQTGDS